MGEQKLPQHLYASLLTSTEAGTEAHSIIANTPTEIGLEVWRSLIHLFDPASAQADSNLMSMILKPPKENVEHIAFPVGTWEEMVRRQHERTGRQAITDDTKREPS